MNEGPSIDLNADIGEGCGFDGELVPLVSSVNIACGVHAGDEATIREAVALAKSHGVAIGAHPGFDDREHFGRREMEVTPSQAADLVLGQLEKICHVAESLGAQVRHVKLHGALYNMASRDRALAESIVGALEREARRSHPWILVALSGSVLASLAASAGLQVVREAFADRAYGTDGMLLPRSLPGSVIKDEAQAAKQALAIVLEGRVLTPGGAPVPIRADTLCIHGDSPTAPGLARAIRSVFLASGVGIRSWPSHNLS